MKKILIYSGTTEGRNLSRLLAAHQLECDVCVATQYGEQVMEPSETVHILVGRKTTEDMAQLWKETPYLCVVDATHPYAAEVSRNIRKSLTGSGIPYLRLERDTATAVEEQVADCRYFDTVQECVKALEEEAKLADEKSAEEAASKGGLQAREEISSQTDKADQENTLSQNQFRVMLTTGSRQLPLFCRDAALRSCLVARILPDPDSVRICYDNGLDGKQIIAMQGPFTEDVNRALIRQYHVTALVTKESGKTGGCDAKFTAASKEHISCFVIRKPKDSDLAEEEEKYIRRDYAGTVEELEKLTGCRLTASVKPDDQVWNEKISAAKKTAQIRASEVQASEMKLSELCASEACASEVRVSVVLAGCGMGGKDAVTGEVLHAVEEADFLFGAERLIRSFHSEKGVFPYYRAEQILPVLEQAVNQADPGKMIRAAVLFSGDTGFYSGCLKLYAAFQKISWAQVKILPGISSISALAARCGVSWQDAAIISTHGIERNQWEAKLIDAVRSGRKVFFLSSGAEDIRLIGELLVQAGLEDTRIHLGYQMSYPEEKVLCVSPEECVQILEKGLYTGLLCREHVSPRRMIAAYADEDMTRTTVPMTKEEIRELSLCKLHLTEGAVVYDIGCGTGSVSMEIAALSPDIRVYAVDDNPEAVQLTRENARKLSLPNIDVREGKAPGILENLPIPTHAFLGGTKGKLDEILRVLYKKNPHMRIVMNAVTLESAGEMSRIREMVPLQQEEIIQVQVSRTRLAGPYHLMQANNPVYIGSFTFKEEKLSEDLSSKVRSAMEPTKEEQIKEEQT